MYYKKNQNRREMETKKNQESEVRRAWRELGDAWLEAYEEIHGKWEP